MRTVKEYLEKHRHLYRKHVMGNISNLERQINTSEKRNPKGNQEWTSQRNRKTLYEDIQNITQKTTLLKWNESGGQAS
jgi:hypothetical protein